MMSELINNRYEIIKTVGQGGMANVYLAFDQILNREVAIKVLKSDLAGDKSSLERFKREAHAATKLSHPNIVDIYDVGDEGDKHYIVMEYIKGYTLKQLIKRRGAIPYKEAVWMMKQLTSALLEAHKNGVIHRDIKSQNVLIKADGTVKMVDFGIALAGNAMQLTSKDSVLGSVHYLAPELAKGDVATMQSDIYSLGIVFYELLTGDVPFKGDTPVQVALQHVRGKIPFVRDTNNEIPQAVENIIIKATAKNIDDRYNNTALMLKDLNCCLNIEHLNDKRLTIASKVEEDYDLTSKKTKKKEKKDGLLFKLFLIAIGVISIVCIFCLMNLFGLFNNSKQFVTMPDISNLTVIEANDLLDDYYLSIDSDNIEWQMTDNTEQGLIISYYPLLDTKVEKGSKVKVIVSNGKYEIMKSYVGMEYVEAVNKLKNLNFEVILEKVFDSNKEPGIVIDQIGLQEYEKFDSKETHTITLKYSALNEIYIESSFIGMNVDDLLNSLIKKGISATKIDVGKEYFDDFEKNKYGPNTVIRTSEELNTYYIQTEDSILELYYYAKEAE